MSSRVLLTYAPVGLLFLLLIPFSYSFRTTFAGKESVCYLAVASLHLISASMAQITLAPRSVLRPPWGRPIYSAGLTVLTQPLRKSLCDRRELLISGKLAYDQSTPMELNAV